MNALGVMVMATAKTVKAEDVMVVMEAERVQIVMEKGALKKNKMEKLICAKCNKIVEGFSKKHVESLMLQHQFKHRNEEKHLKDSKNSPETAQNDTK